MKGPEEKINWRRKGKGGLKGQEEGRGQTWERREKKIQMRAGQDPGRKVRKAEKKATQWFQPGLCILKQCFLNPCFNHKPRNAVWTGNTLHCDISPNVFLLKRLPNAWILLHPSPCLKADLEASAISIRREGLWPWVSQTWKGSIHKGRLAKGTERELFTAAGGLAGLSRSWFCSSVISHIVTGLVSHSGESGPH